MRGTFARRLGAAGVGLWLLATDPVFTQRLSGGDHWVATWATALVARPSQPQQSAALPGPAAPGGQAALAPPRFNNQTLRQIVHTSIGGDRVRVVLSNAFGTAPLRVGAGHIGLRLKESDMVPGSDRPLMFGGRPSPTIPPGAVMISDPVALSVLPFSDLVIDAYLPDDTAGDASPLTTHTGALQTNYVSMTGDHAGASSLPVASTTTAWFFLARVEVAAPAQVGAVVALGDSITDGARSTPDTNSRWPDQLARSLAGSNRTMAVLNMGIAGNRVLGEGNGPSALVRFDRDVLVPPGTTHVIFMEGINDIGRMASADDIIAAHKQIIERSHARGLTIVGATLTPMEDTTLQGYYTAANEAARQSVNQWIRTSEAYDAVIDFDALLRDSTRPTKLQGRFATPDNLHPNDAGYRAMANAVNLDVLTSRTAAAREGAQQRSQRVK